MFNTINQAKQDMIHDSISSGRASEDLQIARIPKANGGRTTWSGKPSRVCKVEAPYEDDAYSRTVRLHELIHANRTKECRVRVKQDLAREGVEDCLVHSIYWDSRKMPNRANRDCYSVGLKEFKTLAPLTKITSDHEYNVTLLVACRSLSIIRKFGNYDRKRAARQTLKTKFGSEIAEEITAIVENCENDKRTKAVKRLDKLMVPPEPKKKDKRVGKLREDNEKTRADRGDLDNDKSRHDMAIIRLPLTEACNSTIRKTTFARSGSRLNPSRLVRAVTTLSTSNLFIRQRNLASGCIVIDGSGSMGCSTERLHKLCSAVPQATVAYYSSYHSSATGYAYGSLCIFADNGRRSSKVSHRGGGNGCDAKAIDWLLQQSGPRIFVSDGEFCGGRSGQSITAHRNISRAVATGRATWLMSIEALEDMLNIK